MYYISSLPFGDVQTQDVRGVNEHEILSLLDEHYLFRPLSRQNMKAKRRASAERFSSARPSLQREVDQKRLDLVAASPPYILKLEQAMTTVAIAHQRENKEPLKMQTRSAYQVPPFPTTSLLSHNYAVLCILFEKARHLGNFK